MIRSRSDWGAAPPARNYTWIGPNVALTVHWVGGTLGAYPPERVPEILQSIQRNHIDVQDWSDIAYSFAVDRFGGLWELRGWDVRTAANGTTAGNSASIAVVYLGGENDPFTDAAKASLVELHRAHLVRGGLPDTWGHTDWTPTTCPGPEILRWVRTALTDDLGPSTTPENDDMTPAQETKLDRVLEVANQIAEGHVAGAVVRDLDVRLSNLLDELVDIKNRLGAIEAGEMPTPDELVIAAARRIALGAPQ